MISNTGFMRKFYLVQETIRHAIKSRHWDNSQLGLRLDDNYRTEMYKYFCHNVS